MSAVFHVVPMWRLTERIVRSTLVTAWRLATSPTSTSPFLANATMDAVVRDPSALAITVGSPPSSTATTELVVPRSMPTARAMSCLRITGSYLGKSPHPAWPILKVESRWRNLTHTNRRRVKSIPWGAEKLLTFRLRLELGVSPYRHKGSRIHRLH